MSSVIGTSGDLAASFPEHDIRERFGLVIPSLTAGSGVGWKCGAHEEYPVHRPVASMIVDFRVPDESFTLRAVWVRRGHAAGVTVIRRALP